MSVWLIWWVLWVPDAGVVPRAPDTGPDAGVPAPPAPPDGEVIEDLDLLEQLELLEDLELLMDESP